MSLAFIMNNIELTNVVDAGANFVHADVPNPRAMREFAATASRLGYAFNVTTPDGRLFALNANDLSANSDGGITCDLAVFCFSGVKTLEAVVFSPRAATRSMRST